MHRLSWWIGLLFAIGAVCFTVGPLPGFVELVGSAVDAAVFFVGSLFFTTAAALQLHQSRLWTVDWWSSAIQFAGTLLFNVNTFRALQTGIDDVQYDRLVWTPDAVGSACFLVSGILAYSLVRGHPRDREWWIAAVNLAGCIAFGISAIAAYVVPTTGSVVDLAAANLFTALGGACFFIGAVLLLPRPESEALPHPAP